MRLLPLLLLAACQAAGTTDTDTDTAPDTDAKNRYADPALWACLPGKSDDVCAMDLTATEIAPDGSTTTVAPERAVNPPFDCFYVYPTVVLTGGQDTDFSEPGPHLDPLLSQAAPFTSLCNVYAPYYRQVSLDSFDQQDLMDTAYGDVKAAFRWFLDRESKGRPFAVIGHSQGTMHLTHLVADEIDGDKALRSRLVFAALVGGSILVPDGADVGGTFQNLPICTTPGQGGCVMAWNSYAEGDDPGSASLFGFSQTPGTHVACTDPQVLAGNHGRLAGSWFATHAYGTAFTNVYNPYSSQPTPFVRIHEALDGHCTTGGGATWYQVSLDPADGDTRPVPPIRNTLQEALGFGMHGLDYNVPIEDLLAAVGQIPMPAAQP